MITHPSNIIHLDMKFDNIFNQSDLEEQKEVNRLKQRILWERPSINVVKFVTKKRRK
jgi:hypothetical protein